MILILSDADDVHADKIEAALELIGRESIRLDVSQFPSMTSWSLRLGEGGSAELHTLRLATRDIDLRNVCAVWNRRLRSPAAPEGLTGVDTEFVRRESNGFLSGIWELLRDKIWVNPMDRARKAEGKAFQLAAAGAVGLRVPRTYMGNDPAEAARFCASIDGRLLYKPFTQFDRSRYQGGDDRGVYANIISASEVSDRSSDFRLAPCILQEYVEKACEVRATVVADACFAAEIHSQSSERSRIDWRRYDFKNTAYLPHLLPSEVEDKLLRLMETLGLLYGAIDLIVTPEGEYIFLEVNQAGQWYWIEELTGLRITERLAWLLAGLGTAEGRLARSVAT